MDSTSRELKFAELFEIATNIGVTARFTSFCRDLSYDGETWQAIPITRGDIQYNSDLEVDSVDISMGLIGIKVGTQEFTIPQVIRRGYLRNCRVRILRVDFSVLDSHSVLFDGFISSGMSFNAGVLSLSVGSLLDKLKEKFPKLIYSELCPHRLFDSYCGLASTAYESTGACSSASNSSAIYSTLFNFSTARPEGYFLKGEIVITSTGNNYLVSKTIGGHFDGYVKLLTPFPESVSLADEFSVYPGCDGQGVTCDERFGNYDNFLGFEYIPKPEMVLL